MKTCTRCGETKPYADFPKFRHARDGYSPGCKACRAAENRAYRARTADIQKARRKAYYEANGAAVRAQAEAWKAANPERHRFLQRRSHLKRIYNMTPEQYDALLEAQGGGCALCGRVADGIRLHVDHDHSCCAGKTSCGECVRGLLCAVCNRLLGWFDNHRAEIENYLGVPACH